MEDDLNFKAVLLRLFNNKNLETNGFDTIEIDLVNNITIYTRKTATNSLYYNNTEIKYNKRKSLIKIFSIYFKQ
jgi:hypothetical protein